MSQSISIAMATYNGAPYLRTQLDSFVAQNVRPDEVVICDDGSTDETIAILETFQSTAPFRVRISRNVSTLGCTKNFEKALTLCTGDIVFLSDQDDAWFPEKLREIVAVFERNPSTFMVLNDKRIADRDLIPTSATMLSNIRRFGSPDACFVAGCCTAFRRKWLELVLPIPNSVTAHDSWLVGLGHRLGVVLIYEKPLQYYRRHETNFSENLYSSCKSLRFFDRLRAELSAMRSRKYDEEVAYWESFLAEHRAERDRLLERQTLLIDLGLQSNGARAMATLSEQIRSIEVRLGLIELPLFKRLPVVQKLLRDGGYAGFSGWKSALKDLVR